MSPWLSQCQILFSIFSWWAAEWRGLALVQQRGGWREVHSGGYMVANRYTALHTCWLCFSSHATIKFFAEQNLCHAHLPFYCRNILVENILPMCHILYVIINMWQKNKFADKIFVNTCMRTGGKIGKNIQLYNNYVCTIKSLITAETGGIMITPRPSPDDSTPKPGFPTRPFFGIDPVLVDDKVHNI